MSKDSEKEGLPALERLFNVAHNETDRAFRVKLFLLGLYDGSFFPYDLAQLRGLDRDMKIDFLRVLAMDCLSTHTKIHLYFDYMAQTFKKWALEMTMDN